MGKQNSNVSRQCDVILVSGKRCQHITTNTEADCGRHTQTDRITPEVELALIEGGAVSLDARDSLYLEFVNKNQRPFTKTLAKTDVSPSYAEKDLNDHGFFIDMSSEFWLDNPYGTQDEYSTHMQENMDSWVAACNDEGHLGAHQVTETVRKITEHFHQMAQEDRDPWDDGEGWARDFNNAALGRLCSSEEFINDYRSSDTEDVNNPAFGHLRILKAASERSGKNAKHAHAAVLKAHRNTSIGVSQEALHNIRSNSSSRKMRRRANRYINEWHAMITDDDDSSLSSWTLNRLRRSANRHHRQLKAKDW